MVNLENMEIKEGRKISMNQPEDHLCEESVNSKEEQKVPAISCHCDSSLEEKIGDGFAKKANWQEPA